MNKKISNSRLLLIFIALLGLYAISRYIEARRSANTFHTTLVKGIDSSKVASVYIYTRENKDKPIHLFVLNGKWMAEQSGITSLAEERSAEYVIDQLQQITPDRLASNDPGQWQHFLVTDTSGTRIVMLGREKDTMLDVIVGKFGFMPQQRQGISYVRINGQKEVYGVPGFLAMNISKDFDSWRNRKIVFPEYLTYSSLSYSCPGDSSFTVKKDSAGAWRFADGAKTDSLATAKALATLCRQNYGSFVNRFDTAAAQPLFTLKVTAVPNGTVILKAYPASDTVNKYVITSSIDLGSYFSGAKDNLFKNLFLGRRAFLYHKEDEKPKAGALHTKAVK